MDKNVTLDIYSKGEYPSCILSNFAENKFFVDGVECASMEGFLQSLKFRSPEKQFRVCLMTGKEAKKYAGNSFAQLRWRFTHNLYWQGKKISRFSDDYQKLLDKAYNCLFENPDFYNALKIASDYKLVHTIGKTDSRKTVLTEYEFISRLNKLIEKRLQL